jgi:hypothetical protein
VDSVHPLVQNVVLLKSVHLLTIRLWPPWVSPAFLSFHDGHAFLLHPFVLRKIHTHYIFTCIAHSKRNYPCSPVLCTTSLIIHHLPSSSRSFTVHIQPLLNPLISPSPSPPLSTVFLPHKSCSPATDPL